MLFTVSPYSVTLFKFLNSKPVEQQPSSGSAWRAMLGDADFPGDATEASVGKPGGHGSRYVYMYI